MKTTVRCLLGLLVVTHLEAATNYLLVPGNLWFTYGNSMFTAPFLLSPSSRSCRYQQVYDQSAFSGLTAAGGGWVTRLLFRPGPASGPYMDQIQSIQINLSTTAREPDGMSTNFLENLGLDDTVVFDRGSLRVDAAIDPDDYLRFATAVPLTRPFFYNPAAGNLLLDVQVYSGMDPLPGRNYYMDAEITFGDGISDLYASSVDSPVGGRSTGGLVTLFEIVPIPEPAPLRLLALGALAWTLRWRPWTRWRNEAWPR
jgi:hypothetical protein